MKKSGWTKEIADDECIFSRELTTDDKEDMTLSQLGTSQFGHSNDIATKDLSADDCDRNESDELEGSNDNTNKSIKIKGKAEEDPSVVESNSNSGTI